MIPETIELRREARACALAVACAAAALALTRLTWPVFAPTPYAPLFAAVAIASHWGSGRAGLLAIALGAAEEVLPLELIAPALVRLVAES